MTLLICLGILGLCTTSCSGSTNPSHKKLLKEKKILHYELDSRMDDDSKDRALQHIAALLAKHRGTSQCLIVKIFRNTSSKLPHQQSSASLYQALQRLSDHATKHNLSIKIVVTQRTNRGGESIVIYNLPDDYCTIPDNN
jgi:hypothetical protein